MPDQTTAPPPPAPGSTRQLDTPPTIGVVCGAEYLAAVARIGADAVDGTTIARDLLPLPDAVAGATPEQTAAADDDRDDTVVVQLVRHVELLAREHAQAARQWYAGRAHTAPAEPWCVAVRDVPVPPQWRAVAPARGRITRDQARRALRARAYRLALRAALGDLLAVVPARPDPAGLHLAARGGTGSAADYYPAELRGRRPSGWLPSRRPGDRTHEQTAYAVAALPHVLGGLPALLTGGHA